MVVPAALKIVRLKPSRKVHNVTCLAMCCLEGHREMDTIIPKIKI